MIIEPKEIPKSQIDRLFVFGCSFTSYIWPTWADILNYDIKAKEFYNFGRCGAGNLMLSCRIIESNKKFNFNQRDLIVVLWSTYFREDRWVENLGGWVVPGNIFTQKTYDESFVKKFADESGYLLRDLALIEMSYSFLSNGNFNAISLLSVPFEYETDKDLSKKISRIYKDLEDKMPKSLFELEMQGSWDNGHSYQHPDFGEFGDYHPDPLRYYNYLEKIGVELSDDTKDYAKKVVDMLKSTKTQQDVIDLFEPILTKNDWRFLF
jgi:hypothetical protein